MSRDVIDWLMAGDPSIRWQTQRDVIGASEAVWAAARRGVATTGWGKRLLEAQDTAGTWGGGLYSPKWTSTTYTLLLLRRLGLPQSNEQAIAGCRTLLDEANWVDGGVSYWSTHTYAERCVNAMVLSVCAYFDVDDPRVQSIFQLLMASALSDGGWNCEDHRGATHSSFHTTISVLEGLAEWTHRHSDADTRAAIARGHEFLLRHEMFKSHRTGRVINDAWTRFWFPPRWHYDVLRGLDHMRSVAAAKDSRASDAIALVREAQRNDGRWGKGSQYSGETFFALEPERGPGRWNTLRALRVLRWWDAAT